MQQKEKIGHVLYFDILSWNLFDFWVLNFVIYLILQVSEI